MTAIRRFAPVAAATVALLALAACNVPAAGAQEPTTTVPATAGAGGITVSGTGEANGTPDLLIVDLGVSVLRPTVNEATTDATNLASAVIDALRGAGVAAEDIQTVEYSIYPEYDYSGDEERLVGYRVSNIVSVKVREVEGSGAVIDAAVTAGGEDVQVRGVRFDLEDDDALLQEARAAAWEQAQAKAQQLAELAGLTLGSAVSINETMHTPQPIPVDMRAEAALDAAATPIEAGQLSVEVSIDVVFSIEG